jgi:DMSO/TMAO reductase YedYZ molybdopterin-dependent catalytic subunit
MRLARAARRLTTDPDGPLRQAPFSSHLHDERVAALLGLGLGVLFGTCFLTGVWSHLQQGPPGWLDLPARPAGLYRVTQGAHVASGIAAVPLLLAKLWVVWPRLLARPPARGAARLVERAGLVPLVAGALFLLFSGVANIAQWYPWRFSFRATHWWVAWMTVGALVAHLGATWATTRRSLRRVAREPSTTSTQAGPGLSRRGLLATVGASAAVLTLTTVGQTLAPLRRLALLAPRDPAVGPQGRPVNRSAANAGVVELARAADYRLTVAGPRGELHFTAEELARLPSRDAELPMACVEGWSFSARWSGVPVRDLVALVGGAGGTVQVESLEPVGAYRTSTLGASHAADPDTLLATHLDGRPLSLDHGYPCRLVAPNRPGVQQTKWVTRLVVTSPAAARAAGDGRAS